MVLFIGLPIHNVNQSRIRIMRPKSRIGWTRSSVCFVRQDKYYGPTMTSTGTVYLITGSNHITLEDTILYLSCILAIEIHTHLLYLCHSFASSGLPSIVYRSLLNDIWFQGSFQYEHLEWVQVARLEQGVHVLLLPMMSTTNDDDDHHYSWFFAIEASQSFHG